MQKRDVIQHWTRSIMPDRHMHVSLVSSVTTTDCPYLLILYDRLFCLSLSFCLISHIDLMLYQTVRWVNLYSRRYNMNPRFYVSGESETCRCSLSYFIVSAPADSAASFLSWCTCILLVQWFRRMREKEYCWDWQSHRMSTSRRSKHRETIEAVDLKPFLLQDPDSACSRLLMSFPAAGLWSTRFRHLLFFSSRICTSFRLSLSISLLLCPPLIPAAAAADSASATAFPRR